MKQTATVLRHVGTQAEVTVHRQSACAGCHVGACTGCGKQILAMAENPLQAAVGATVELETASHTVLGYAAAVFIFPLCAAFLAYIVAARAMSAPIAAPAAGGVALLVTFCLAAILCNRRAAKHTHLTIVGILPPPPTESEEPPHAN